MLMQVVSVCDTQLLRMYTIAMDKAPRAFFFFLLKYSKHWQSSSANTIIPVLDTS